MAPLGVQRIRPWPTCLGGGELFQLATELAGVTGLGLFLTLEVLGQFLLGREGGAVDALELLVLFVTAMVGARDGEQLEGLQLGGVAHVGAGAEVHELAVLVEGDFFALGNVGEAAQLVALLAALLDDGDGLFAGDFLADKGLVLVGDLLHLGLDLQQVVGGEFVVEVDVIVEPGVGRRADVELRLGKEAEDGGRKDVRT